MALNSSIDGGQTRSVVDDLDALLEVLPLDIRQEIERAGDLESLLEVVLDLGREPEARFLMKTLTIRSSQVTQHDLDHVIQRVGEFGKDNRAGIERTLHRISAIRNRRGKIIGLTCRVGRAVYGTVDIIRDVVETGKNLLILGRPGVGKTTKCREVARVLSEEFGKRVIVVDTSNEIAGDGDIPHPGIGKARRMQVPSPDLQHTVMIEAVENHMPEVIVIDEIGTSEEALAARTIAERGVQLIATAHGNSLDRLLMNPTLSDIVGGIQTVTLGDEEAKRRGTQKTILERKAPPTFQVVVEILEMEKLAIHHDVAEAVDHILQGYPLEPEIRFKTLQGRIEIVQPVEQEAPLPSESEEEIIEKGRNQRVPLKVFPYGVNRKRLEQAIRDLGAPALITKDHLESDVIVSLKSNVRQRGQKIRETLAGNIPVYVAKSNTYAQIQATLRDIFKAKTRPRAEIALKEAEQAIHKVLSGEEYAELYPQRRHIRRIQHQLVAKYGLRSESFGVEPQRRVTIFRE
ncbi:MAG: AAA family ATPase [Candidatus Tectomicrobia bacterium]|nr:AAA family ATPase [Candidatus Tectomicrobia bacterium]